jgi:RNA polymerase sigma-70 factor (ECF subfamily)
VLRAWRSRGRAAAADRPAAFVTVVARNEALRRLAANGGLPPLDDLHEQRPSTDEAAADLRVDVRRAVSRLTPEEQRLIALRYGADMTHAAIAAAVGMPEGTVKVRLHRARRSLRRLLIHYDPA